jgi:hypothetical protein
MDYMPVATQASGPEQARQLIRHVKVTRGTMTFRLECSPAFDYARQEHETEITTEGARFWIHSTVRAETCEIAATTFNHTGTRRQGG